MDSVLALAGEDLPSSTTDSDSDSVSAAYPPSRARSLKFQVSSLRLTTGTSKLAGRQQVQTPPINQDFFISLMDNQQLILSPSPPSESPE